MELTYFDEKINQIQAEIELSKEDILRTLYERALDRTYDVAETVLKLNQAFKNLPKYKAASECRLNEETRELSYECSNELNTVDGQVHNKSFSQWVVVRKMFYQMNVDTIEYAQRILPKVICDYILRPEVHRLNIDIVNEKLGVLLDMNSSSNARKFAEENLKIDNWNCVSDENMRQKLFHVEFYIYAINLWISAAIHTVEMIDNLEVAEDEF